MKKMCFFKKKCFKDNNKPTNWVSHSKLRPLEIYEFFKITPNFHEKEASETGKTEEEKITDKRIQMMMMQMQKRIEKS